MRRRYAPTSSMSAQRAPTCVHANQVSGGGCQNLLPHSDICLAAVQQQPLIVFCTCTAAAAGLFVQKGVSLVSLKGALASGGPLDKNVTAESKAACAKACAKASAWTYHAPTKTCSCQISPTQTATLASYARSISLGATSGISDGTARVDTGAGSWGQRIWHMDCGLLGCCMDA